MSLFGEGFGWRITGHAQPRQALLDGRSPEPGALTFGIIELSVGTRLAGVAIAAMGLALLAWLFPQLGNNVTATALVKDQHTLVTTGPYRWIRHPLYLAGVLLGMGLGLGVGSVPIVALAIGFVAVWMTIVIPREEAALADRFGAPYQRYRAATGALLPRVSALRGVTR